MKKIFISLILLFGFLVSVPQVALGDIPTPLTSQQKYEIEENNKKESNYLHEKDVKREKNEERFREMAKDVEEGHYFKARLAFFVFIGWIICVLIITVFDRMYFKRRKK